MKESHVALILCGVSIILFCVSLSPWLPFYAEGTGSSFLMVKVTMDGKPLENTKVDIYDFLTPFQSPPVPQIDPAKLGTPIKEGFTNNLGEIDFLLSRGNYTVRIENKAIGWDMQNVFLTEPEQEVNFDFFSIRQEQVKGTYPKSSLNWVNIGMLCTATALMATGVVIFLQSRRK